MSDRAKDSSAGNDRAKPEVPDFDLIRPIGEGGFGQVWLAKNRTTGHLRAVKIIALRGSASTDAAGREITSLTRLEATLQRQHPHLVTIYHVGKTPDHLFYVMELADDVTGGSPSVDPDYRPATLETRLRQDSMSSEECDVAARELLTGLTSLHEASMVHRDVKPANCLFIDGKLKLADFGLLTEDTPQVSRVGTGKYMPPDGRMDIRADVYAAGLVIYEMLTGLPAERFPRLGTRAREVVRQPRLNSMLRLALRACQPEPGERFKNAGQMLTELTVGPRAEHGTGRRSRLLLAGITACLVCLIAVATLWLKPWEPTQPSERQPAQAGPPAAGSVDVNFLTERPYFDATIYLNGKLLEGPDGPYMTPETVEGLPAKPHEVVFKLEGMPDLELGTVDFAQTRQVVGTWPKPDASR